jgi:F-box domain
MHLNSILILPDELISNILKCTDYKTVIACRRVGICPVVFSPAALSAYVVSRAIA